MDGRAEPGREAAARVSVSGLPDDEGIRIDDRIERRQCEVRTGRPVSPGEIDGERFRYPIDVAVSFDAARLTVTPSSTLYVHEGREPTEVEMFQTASFGPGTYTLELSGPLKLYLAVEGPLEVEKQVKSATVRLEEVRSVAVGARSYHERPAATITTTEDPADLARAVSAFGSALKTTGSERSYPTLRGHPPALDVGAELAIPEGVSPPATDVRLEVPASVEAVCSVASLAYYLGCPVRAGHDPRLVVGGTSHELAGPDGFGATVERLLKRTFFLDCLVRTAGPRRIPQYERRCLESDLPVDLEALYGEPAATRLARYMTVPYDRIAGYVPTWKVAAWVQPDPTGIEALPFLANDLAVVDLCDPLGRPNRRHVGSRGPVESREDASGASSWVASGGPPAGDGDTQAGGSTASAVGGTGSGSPGDAGAGDGPIERVWIGDGLCSTASKAMPEAFRNRLDRRRREGGVEVAVVCNDPEMLAEQDAARDVYGSREDLPFEVAVYEGLTTDQLEVVLASDLDFLHYIGHVDEAGFECVDGTLDVRTLDTVAVDVVFLNACRSYDQGVALIERGAVAGVVTMDDVIDSGAVRIGETMARLLNLGFPLRSALDIARGRSIVGSQYLLIGDGNADISQARGLVPVFVEVESTGQGTYRVRIVTHPTRWAGMGSQFRPALEDCEEVFLAPGELPALELSADELEEYLATGTFPVRLDGRFTWSDALDVTGEGARFDARD